MVSLRAARRYRQRGAASNALHFGSDLAGSLAVLVGLVCRQRRLPRRRRGRGALRRAARPRCGRASDAAQRRRAHGPRAGRRRGRGARGDRGARAGGRAAPAAHAAGGRAALRRRRDRRPARRGGRAGPRGGGRTSRTPCSARCRRATSSSTSSRASDEQEISERAHAAALAVPRVREMHNVTVLDVGTDARDLAPPEAARATCRSTTRTRSPSRSSARSATAVPEAARVQTHLEPLAEAGPRARRSSATRPRSSACVARGDRAPRRASCASSRADDGLVAFLTLALDAHDALAEAHARASASRSGSGASCPEIAEFIVHTEP